MSLFRVLHISDIHIGKTYKSSEDIAYKVISDIENNGLYPIRAVAVTGDIFDGQIKSTNALIDEAVEFFNILINEINTNQPNSIISKSDFIFVPGNHDLIRTEDKSEMWSKYSSFLERFYGTIPSSYNKENFSVFVPYHKDKVVFIGFNSCQIEKKKVFDKNFINTFEKNMGVDVLLKNGIDKNNLISILDNETASEYEDFGKIPISQIVEIKRKIKGFDDYNVIALFHHHFYLFPEIVREFGDTSLVRNYAEVIQELKYINVKTVLHGHKHFDMERPLITDDYYNTTESIIDVFAGGSLGTSRTERHTFNIIDFYDAKDNIKLTQNKFIYNGEMLDKISIKQIPPKNSANKIVKLYEILETVNLEVYNEYIKCSEKIFKINSDCIKIVEWTGEALTGFSDTYKYLSKDYKNILFLLYAINYRTLSYKNFIESEETYFNNCSSILKDFYKTHLSGSGFSLQEEDYHKLFAIKDLRKLANSCDLLLNNTTNRQTQVYLAFSMVGIFFSDLYLILTKYADDFKETIKYKVNIKIEANKFHENIPAPKIVIKSDSDRRSVYIQLRCNEATAHKMAVLFVKEFDLLINKFEDYFKLIGLKLYYLLPEIDKDNLKDSMDNYNFEAYIPTLLPLLTGDNIYPSKVVFARELIQNSIDAIAVREAKDKTVFDNKIVLDIGQDENGKRFFKITDCGTGMDRYKIERYFTSIGRSFYSGDEYEDLQISYKPISSFGIGFLSSFMVCQEIDVKTKYFEPGSEGLKLHIPNYDGCFFIEKECSSEVGTELKLHIESDLQDSEIIKYIKKIMLDIKYEISINSNGESINIPAYQIRKSCQDNKLVFFIPLTEKNEILNIDYKEEVLTRKFVNKYEYGILIVANSKRTRNRERILNAGILVEHCSINTLFNYRRSRAYDYRDDNRYNQMYLNFPANWIQLDVSREKITGFSKQIINLEKDKQSNNVGNQIADALYSQIIDVIEYSKTNIVDTPVAYLQEVIEDALNFNNSTINNDTYKKLISLRYSTKIIFCQDGVTFKVVHSDNKKKGTVYYQDERSRERKNQFIEKWYNNKSESVQSEVISKNMYKYLKDLIYAGSRGISINKKLNIKEIFEYTGFDLGLETVDIFHVFALIVIFEVGDKLTHKSIEHQIYPFIEYTLMESLRIGDVEKGNNTIKVSYNDLKIYNKIK